MLGQAELLGMGLKAIQSLVQRTDSRPPLWLNAVQKAVQGARERARPYSIADSHWREILAIIGGIVMLIAIFTVAWSYCSAKREYRKERKEAQDARTWANIAREDTERRLQQTAGTTGAIQMQVLPRAPEQPEPRRGTDRSFVEALADILRGRDRAGDVECGDTYGRSAGFGRSRSPRGRSSSWGLTPPPKRKRDVSP